MRYLFLILLLVSCSKPYETDHYKKRLASFSSGDTVFIGDSHIERGPFKVNQGIGSDVTEGVLNRLEYAKGAKVVYLLVGVNDIVNGRELSQIKRNEVKIIDRLNPSRVIVIQIPPVARGFHLEVNDKIEKLNREMESYCKENKIDYVSYDLSRDGYLREELVMPDKIHLNDSGYTLLKNALGWKQ